MDELPQLLPPAPVQAHHAVWPKTTFIAAGALAIAISATTGFLTTMSNPKVTVASGANRSIVRLSTAQAPGIVTPIEPLVANSSKHIFSGLAMPEPEKERLRAQMRNTQLRIGAITVWDTVDEDGDRIRITAAGFTQDVTILHKPATFFVPYLPGGSVRIEATRDGGGGVTLGMRTVLGDMPLPALSVGQVLEIALP